MFKNDSIIITTNTYKKELLVNSKELKNIKIYTLNEFNKLYYYDYNNETILYVMNKYNVIYEIAKIYLNNLIYIEDKKYKSNKLNMLSNLKKDLIDNHKLIINKLFKEYLKDKKIYIYNLPHTKELDYLINELDIEIINDKENKYTNHKVHELSTIEDEVVYVSNYICDLLSKGIDIKNIYLTNLSDEYYKLIRRIFPMFNIPYTLKDNGSIYGTYLSNKFLELYNNDMNKTLTELKDYVDSEETEDIYNQILDIVNNYAFIDNYEDVLPLIKYDLKNTKLKKKDIINSVHESSINDTYTDEDYVILMSYNQGIIPSIYKDEDYLSDKDRLELNISLTIDKNNIERNNVINNLSNIKNLFITYKLLSNGEKHTISNINEELGYEIIKENITNYSYSNLYNQIKLASLKDDYNKYGTKSELLYTLSNTYKQIPYNTYNHTFKGIDVNDLHKFLDNKLSLSYTKVDNYYKCPFSYYINYILNLNIYEDTFYQKIGTLFHAVLERMNENKSYEELWTEETNNLQPFNTQEEFFLEKLKDELLFIIETIKEQENYTDLHDELHEEKIYTSLSGDMKITFSGIVDKIKYKKEDNRTIVAIIDYKTGTPSLDLSTIPHGIGMQLPVYLYLAKNTNKLTNIEVAGFYLQHILNNEISVEEGKDYTELKKKELQLQGYSNNSVDILSTFDKSFDNSNMIRSMKLNKDNSFYRYAKTLSSNEMNILSNIAETNIQNAANKISNAEFEIAPKKIGDTNYGCMFCKYKDICFHTNDDIVELKEYTKEEIFGGEE